MKHFLPELFSRFCNHFEDLVLIFKCEIEKEKCQATALSLIFATISSVAVPGQLDQEKLPSSFISKMKI